MIVHGMDGYDEISLTGDTKIIDRDGERIFSAEDLHFKNINSAAIFGGNSMEEATDIFMKILERKGTEAQNSVVLANAAMALKNTGKYGNYEDSLAFGKGKFRKRKSVTMFEKFN